MNLRVVLFLCATCAGGLPAFAQQSIDLASISGRVTDSSGAVVADAEVTARHTPTNLTSTVLTDEAGRFRFPYLRVGPYEIVVRRQGFQDAIHHLTLAAGAAFELPITLAVAGIDTSVTVTADATVLEAARSQITHTLADREIQALPMNGRNFLDLALLVPGVSPANVGSTQLFPETSAVPGISLAVGSQRNLSNNFIVDGLSANDDAAGLSGMPYAVDAIEQFQVVTSGAHAELGRALGGYANVVTKSGTNTLRGTAYTYLRDDRLNARNPLLGARLPMEQAQYGGSVGGPLDTDRTFYFTNIEQKRLDQTGLTTISNADAAAINARLAEVGYQGPRVTSGVYPNPVDSTNLFARLDHRVSGRDQVSVRYSLYDVAAENARGAGGLNAPSASSGLDNLDQAVSLGNTLAIGSRTVIETRAQVARSDLAAPPSDPIGPAVRISGVAAFGTSSSSPTRRTNTLYEVVSNISHHTGVHAFKAGFDFLHNDNRIVYPRAARGAYTFASLANFLAGIYDNGGFTQTFGVSDVVQSNPNVGMYVQDEWKATAQLTLNLGLRYDLQFLETIDTDTNNVSPRVGLAWSPFDSRRTIVRANAGLFYDRVPLRALANALLSAGNTTALDRLRQINVTLSPTQAGAPVFPEILDDVVPSTTLVNFTTMDRELQNARSTQASVEVERQLGDRASVGVGYQYLRGRNLLLSINQNVPSCLPSGTNNGCRPNPAYANNNQYSSAGESTYHGLHVSFTHRAARWSQYRLSYTLSTSKNNVGEFFFSSPIDPLDLSKDWGRSDNDQRHRLAIAAAIESPTRPDGTLVERLLHGFRLSAILQAYSALPLNVLSGGTTIQGTPARPLVNGEFIERNAGVGSDLFNLNLRVSREFAVGRRTRVEALVEAFNVTNRENVVTRNPTFGPGEYPIAPLPTFRQPTAVGEPRSFQVGARVRF